MRQRREDWSGRSEQELAALALHGELEAWGELARRHNRRVVVTLLARGLPLQSAEDIAQDTWIKLMENQRSGRLTSIQLPGLAIAQAQWFAKEAARTGARRAALREQFLSMESDMTVRHSMVDGAGPEQGALSREYLQVIERELLQCSERAQQVFRAVYEAEPRAHADVARELGMSVQRVRQILCELRARMCKALAGVDGEDDSWSI